MDVRYRHLYKRLGQNIAYFRKIEEYTQQELAELVGIDRSHLSAIETAARGISLDVLFDICKVLQIAPKELFDFRG